jgi:hypothetical protein
LSETLPIDAASAQSGAETRARAYYHLDPALIVPEYVISFEYTRTATAPSTEEMKSFPELDKTAVSLFG